MMPSPVWEQSHVFRKSRKVYPVGRVGAKSVRKKGVRHRCRNGPKGAVHNGA